ncbi:uncharacterized protein FA14DRAFT_160727 [Meira miltonrushii]|uniref:PIN domain-containing protein n=1 Tax=Meira miltonrushii TaxID=1280837 RepID=A0A316VH72_9BASI|nr:uncharacterized protein FA14DRAFT_160727 [Meira miltonrushii]PWN35683.1 hypothetical protein FA14DRAFT_160727 [Meira miltonrushii]
MTSTEKEQTSPTISAQTSYLFRQQSSNSIRNSINSVKSNTRHSIGKSMQDGTPTSNSDVEENEKSKCSDAKEALCRRMGAMFLRHRVEQLTDDVEKMQQQGKNTRCPIQNRMQRKSNASSKNEFGHIGSAESLSVANTATTSTDLTTLKSGSEEKVARYADENSTKQQRLKGPSCKKTKISSFVPSCKQQQRDATNTSQIASADPTLPPSKPSSAIVTRIIIADASLLIYSLRTVHDYLKAGDCQVIVPCEALSTLDVLKKGVHTLNWAARRATRFLDERFSVWDDGGDDAEEMQFSTREKREASNLRPGLFPQGLQQRLNIFKNQVKNEEILAEKLDISIESLKKAPLAATKTFDCALYFLEKYQNNDQISCALAIALPPPHLDFEQEALHSESNCSLRFAERADGNVMLQWSKECGLLKSEIVPSPRLIVAPTAASWLTVASTVPTSVVA